MLGPHSCASQRRQREFTAIRDGTSVGFLHARETMEVDRKKQPDVNSLWPNPWLLIALRSPNVPELRPFDGQFRVQDPDFAPEGVLAASRNSIDGEAGSNLQKSRFAPLLPLADNPTVISDSVR